MSGSHIGDLDTYVAKAVKMDLPYHWWAADKDYQVYIVDPTGFSV